MRAVRFTRFGGPEVLEIVQAPDPHPAAGEVRISVRAVGLGATDWKVRAGELGGEAPQTTGRDVAGVVDEVGPGVTGTVVGDRVFGASDDGTGVGAGAAELVVLGRWASIPEPLGFADAAALPVAVETATRGLDELGVEAGTTLLVNGASGGIGTAAVQLARARGARVIGTAGPANLDAVRLFGADAVPYGPGLPERVRAVAADGVDRALDVAGHDALPDLLELAGGAAHVVTLADVEGARRHGVRFSTGDRSRAFRALDGIGDLIATGRFWLPVDRTFPFEDIAEAHRAGERGHLRGRLVLLLR